MEYNTNLSLCKTNDDDKGNKKDKNSLIKNKSQNRSYLQQILTLQGIKNRSMGNIQNRISKFYNFL